MKKSVSTGSLIDSEVLREVVLEKEAEILAEILEVKKTRSQMIKEAKQKSKLLYNEMVEQAEATIKEQELQLKDRMAEIMQQLDRQEQEYLNQMEQAWNQKKDKAIEYCLNRILP